MVFSRLNLTAVLMFFLLPIGGSLFTPGMATGVSGRAQHITPPREIAPLKTTTQVTVARSPHAQAAVAIPHAHLLKNGLRPVPNEDGASVDSSPSVSAILLDADGRLEEGDRVAYQDGSLYDEYEINGQEGQQIQIRLESVEFDPYLVLMHPNGDILARNDDINEDNLNSLLDYQLPQDGVYRVIANGFDRYSQGHYRLTVLILNTVSDPTNENEQTKMNLTQLTLLD
jgi:serine protease Do